MKKIPNVNDHIFKTPGIPWVVAVAAASAWLLLTGLWNDSGVWDDTANWID